SRIRRGSAIQPWRRSRRLGIPSRSDVAESVACARRGRVWTHRCWERLGRLPWAVSTTNPVLYYRLKPLTFASRLGGWLFRQRPWVPLPLVAALLLIPAPLDAPGPSLWIIGALIVALGEAIRLWAVHHIGAISRTRSDRLGPLVSSGPFAF